jgi:type IV pilus assembly protein PilV
MNMRSRLHGYIMLEVLIAVLVVSLGFIGWSGMQVRGLRWVNESMYRSKAVYLAYQMTDRIRANLPGATAGSYNSLSGTITDPGCAATNCAAAQMALADYAAWSTEIAALLPSGAGAVCIDSSPDDGTSTAAACDGLGTALVVKVWWSEGGVERGFATTFRP